MALNTTISDKATEDACNAIVDLVDAGAGAGTITIYGNDGTGQPADPDATATGAGTVLATITCETTAFGAATTSGVATLQQGAGKSATAAATGTAAWFRVADSDGNGVYDGECGTSGADMNLDSVSITSGQTVTISSATFTMPQT